MMGTTRNGEMRSLMFSMEVGFERLRLSRSGTRSQGQPSLVGMYA
jgi:hypothetical protein